MSTNRLARVEKALRIGMVEGQTVDQLVRRIMGTRAGKYKDGILDISRQSARTLALTANSTIANAARKKVYQDNSDLIDKLKWVSTLDSRTSPVCQARDGHLYDLDQPHPTPPAHPRCRSIMIPVTVSFKSLGLNADDYTPQQRASMDGQVPGNTTFGDWLKNQPVDRVEEIMGKGRANIFLNGKMDFKDFFNSDDEYYTLDELKKRSK
jgi:SPP1 gp7 family putative phage head morphogenesis protein